MDTGNSKDTLIKIQMADTFYHDFKFDLSLPDPSPGPKYLYYPFNHESYYKKPKLTNLNFMEKPQIFTRADLGIPIDDLNIKPELYNHDPERNNTLTPEDEILFGDKKQRKPSIGQPVVRGPSEQTTPVKTAAPAGPINPPRRHKEDDSEDEGFDLNDSVITPEEIIAQLSMLVGKTFEASHDLQVGAHPTKPGVTAAQVFNLVPNFNDIDKKFVTVTYEANLPNITGRNALTMRKDKDGIKHITEYLETENAMKEESRVKVQANLDYLYYLNDSVVMKKELVERVQYILMFDPKDLQARYQKLSNEIILRKIKAPGVNKKRESTQPFYIVGRKPYLSEAAFKNKLLSSMGDKVQEKYCIKETQPDPIVEAPMTQSAGMRNQNRQGHYGYEDHENTYNGRQRHLPRRSPRDQNEGEEEDGDFLDDGEEEGDDEEDDDHRPKHEDDEEDEFDEDDESEEQEESEDVKPAKPSDRKKIPDDDDDDGGDLVLKKPSYMSVQGTSGPQLIPQSAPSQKPKQATKPQQKKSVQKRDEGDISLDEFIDNDDN